MSEKHEPHPLSDKEIDEQIKLTEIALGRTSSGRTIGETITVAMGRLDDDPEKVAEFLVSQHIFDNIVVARAAVERYKKYGERLHEEEKPL